MYIVDTNILVNYFISDFLTLNKEQLSQVDKFISLRGQRILPDFVITELFVLMERVVGKKFKFSKDLVNSCVLSITKNLITPSSDHQVIFPTEKELLKALKDYSTYRNRVGFVDFLIVVLAKSRKFEILTGDKELLKVFNSY